MSCLYFIPRFLADYIMPQRLKEWTESALFEGYESKTIRALEYEKGKMTDIVRELDKEIIDSTRAAKEEARRNGENSRTFKFLCNEIEANTNRAKVLEEKIMEYSKDIELHRDKQLLIRDAEIQESAQIALAKLGNSKDKKVEKLQAQRKAKRQERMKNIYKQSIEKEQEQQENARFKATEQIINERDADNEYIGGHSAIARQILDEVRAEMQEEVAAQDVYAPVSIPDAVPVDESFD